MVKRVLSISLAIKTQKIRLLYKFLSKISACKRDLDERNMYFLIKDEKFSEKYNEIWEKLSNNIKKDFENGPVYNKKYLKTIIKPYNGKVNANFHKHKFS